MNFFDRSSKNPQISNFMKIRPMGAEFFHADGRTDRRDEANIRFSQLCKSAQRWNDWTHFRTFVQCTVYLRPQNPQHINTACSVQPVGLLIWQQSDSAVPFLSAVTVLKVWSFGCRHSIYKALLNAATTRNTATTEPTETDEHLALCMWQLVLLLPPQ